MPGLFTFGVNEGLPEFPNKKYRHERIRRCPHVTIKHNEYDCTAGKSVVRFPALSREISGQNRRFSMFTNLRDPIERIGSQAFYYKGLSEPIFNRKAVEMCGSTRGLLFCGNTPKYRAVSKELCKCTKDSLAAAHEEIRTNATVWWQWIRRGQSLNQSGDMYLSNYYVKRLAHPPDEYTWKKNAQIECMHDPSTCAHKTDLRLVNSFGGKVFCGYDGSREGKIDLNLTEALHVAKHLLTDYYEFVVTELYDEDYTVQVIRRALHDKSFNLTHVSHTNTGKKASRASSYSKYSKLMPPSILKFFHEDNAYDIALYKYAVSLFWERARKADSYE
eukprot:CAMPEP_0185041394 /NCGR_PEP_ID=MMETSP1103-20130426/40630_1 /TAXON_ID=36769 /ORGANISM="Paraphysomonas bandaiensis, Strain Caron Lab Isolate" /LENGTH=331 /DNA_ID=CAMNT_0027581101 /DNA_START=237 /DNA_END=1232 /DNA_ORIENTATION=-